MKPLEKETLFRAIGAFVAEQTAAVSAAVEKRIAAIEAREPIKGEKGDKGDAGERGEAGSEGLKGADGKDGLRGEKGETGERGEKGERGPEGQKGEAGRDGKDAVTFDLPDDLAEQVAKAICVLAESPLIVPKAQPIIVNVTTPAGPDGKRKVIKTVTTDRDSRGNLVGKITEEDAA